MTNSDEDMTDAKTIDDLKDRLSLEYERVLKWKKHEVEDEDESDEENEKAFFSSLRRQMKLLRQILAQGCILS